MKDLKHLYYFERLLDDANNELVRQAKEEEKNVLEVFAIKYQKFFLIYLELFLFV